MNSDKSGKYIGIYTKGHTHRSLGVWTAWNRFQDPRSAVGFSSMVGMTEVERGIFKREWIVRGDLSPKGRGRKWALVP